MPLARFALLLLIAALACACADDADDASDDAAARAEFSLALLAPEQMDDLLSLAVDDAAGLLAGVLGEDFAISAELPDDSNAVALLLGQRAVDYGVFEADEIEDLPDQAFRLRSAQIEGCAVIGVAGRDDLATAYGLYELLERMGLRFFHPEQTLIPQRERLVWPSALDKLQAPSLGRRGFHVHTMHPLEAIDFLLSTDQANLPYAYRWIDWCSRNKINYVQWELLRTVDLEAWLPVAGQIVDYAHRRGVQVGIVVSYVFSQQKSFMLVPRPRELCQTELEANIDLLMQVPWDHINVELGGSEFVEADDELSVAWMDLTVAYLAERYPQTTASVKVHCSTGQTAEHYGGINFNFIPKFADPRLGVYPHSVMFYGLEGKADVYGNQDLTYMRDFLYEMIGQRPVYYYPETAYWCTFDIDVPLFLPLYLFKRWQDTALIAAAGADGQVAFTSGHEWGYWLHDWALARSSWDASADWTDALIDLSAPFGPQAAAEVGQVLTELISYQQSTLIDRGLIAYLLGEDTPDELGWLAGVLTHPKPITFKQVYAMDAEQLASFEEQIVPQLLQMAQGYETWAGRLEALRPGVAEEAAPWLEELIDGVRVNAERSRHSYLLYSGCCQIRGAELGVAGHSQDQGFVNFAAAIDAKWRAVQVIRKREQAYRYPLEWSSGWDAPGNVTSYPFRYLWTVHHAIFFTRREVQAMERNFDPLLMNYHSLLQELL